MMGVACGIMGWSPDQFWNSTPHEYMAAVEALRRFHQPGGGNDEAEFSTFAEFKATVEAGERARNADR